MVHWILFFGLGICHPFGAAARGGPFCTENWTFLHFPSISHSSTIRRCTHYGVQQVRTYVMATCRRIDIWTSSCALAIIKNTQHLLRKYYRVHSAHRAHLSHAFIKPQTRNRLIHDPTHSQSLPPTLRRPMLLVRAGVLLHSHGHSLNRMNLRSPGLQARTNKRESD